MALEAHQKSALNKFTLPGGWIRSGNPYDKDKGRLSKVSAPELIVPEEEAPSTIVPIEDRRLNLNAAPAEQIAKRLPGVGFATAKKIVELRMSLSGERFANLKQLENIPRVNWEQLIEEDLIFIS